MEEKVKCVIETLKTKSKNERETANNCFRAEPIPLESYYLNAADAYDEAIQLLEELLDSEAKQPVELNIPRIIFPTSGIIDLDYLEGKTA